VEALQYNQSGDACPDHAAEADGQPWLKIIEGECQVGFSANDVTFSAVISTFLLSKVASRRTAMIAPKGQGLSGGDSRLSLTTRLSDKRTANPKAYFPPRRAWPSHRRARKGDHRYRGSP
jgi:hypothetical protein